MRVTWFNRRAYRLIETYSPLIPGMARKAMEGSGARVRRVIKQINSFLMKGIHVLITWVVAVALYPFFLYSAGGIFDVNPRFLTTMDMLTGYVFDSIVAGLFSFPLLFPAFLLLNLIANISLTTNARFYLWLIVLPGLCLFELLAIGGEPTSDRSILVDFFTPVVATAIATVIRYRPFTKLIASIDALKEPQP
ncbi:MAG TPA: hypothetical protein VK644_07000, partial [Chitinophagaceae bacterium]|nr:hypothetical protein [Chitinophagaceae bacterium]